jgi:predicted amidohydrolase
MTSAFQVACVQNCAGDDLDLNIRETLVLTRAAHAAGADLVCLPEYFHCLYASDELTLANALPEQGHPALLAYKTLAAELRCWILLGSISVKLTDGMVNNRSYLLDADGKVVASYNKIHLFDVNLSAGERYLESASVSPGVEATVASTPWGVLGMTICYDLRFPYLYRLLAHSGASFLSVPAAFTATTGKDHWRVLLRARAIETGCFVFAPAQCGVRAWGRATYGRSLVVDPWGHVLCDGGEDVGFVIATVDPAEVYSARARIASLDHDRPVRASQ